MFAIAEFVAFVWLCIKLKGREQDIWGITQLVAKFPLFLLNFVFTLMYHSEWFAAMFWEWWALVDAAIVIALLVRREMARK